jgi:hypothetical protein
MQAVPAKATRVFPDARDGAGQALGYHSRDGLRDAQRGSR